MLKEIWESKWVTNNGQFHAQLEKALCEYLKVPYISLFTNGTLPLLTALQALRITGEVIPLHIPILTLTAAVFAVWTAQFVHLIALRIAAFVIIMLCLLFLLRILSKEDLAWIKGLVRKK